jgi:hypothetical protein
MTATKFSLGAVAAPPWQATDFGPRTLPNNLNLRSFVVKDYPFTRGLSKWGNNKLPGFY